MSSSTSHVYPPYFASRINTLKTIFDAVEEQKEKSKPVDKYLSAFFRSQRNLGSKDRKFISACIFGYYRWLPWLIKINDEENQSIRLLVGYLLDENENIPLIQFWSEQLNKPKLTENIFFASANLELKKEWFSENFEMVETKELFPLDAEIAQKNKEIWQRRPPVWMRMCLQKKMGVIQELKQKNILFQEEENFPLAIKLPRNFSVQNLASFHEGSFEIQDIASQCVADICQPQAEELWYDACAGAGGKTLHLADQNPAVQFIAGDLRQAVLSRIEKRKERSGLKNIQILLAEEVPSAKFDGVLVDVPCSNSGTWRRNPWLKDRLTKSLINNFARAQGKILQEKSQYVKPGGILVYSTCSQYSEENEEVILHFLQKNTNFTVENQNSPFAYSKSLEGTLYFSPPLIDGDCIFVAKLRKTPE